MKRLLAGPRAIEEALNADAQRVVVVYATPERLRELEPHVRRTKVPCEPRSAEELDALARGLKHQGALAVTGEYPYADLDALLDGLPSAPLLVALDQISDPHNFGAIVRSSVAFGAGGVITLKDRAAPVTPVVVRASAGATERAQIARVTNLARTLGSLRERGMQVVGLAADGGETLDQLFYPSAGRVLVIGSEGDGLRRLTREHCDVLARIEMPGGFESLNASVAASIALYESARGRKHAGS
ncbi:MAG: 23S rRNA (guanosine(2251)-2'-O)-methyltransferase RlmB [Polyangiales bacterium]